MEEYTGFRITGVSFKFICTGVTNFDIRPNMISVAYSDVEIISPLIPDERLHALPTYQIMSVDPCKTVKRYYTNYASQKRMGVSWAPTKEFVDGLFNTGVPTYDTQLTIDKGASVHIKIKRALMGDEEKPFADFGKLFVTYYVTFKGVKGIGSLARV